MPHVGMLGQPAGFCCDIGSHDPAFRHIELGQVNQVHGGFFHGGSFLSGVKQPAGMYYVAAVIFVVDFGQGWPVWQFSRFWAVSVFSGCIS